MPSALNLVRFGAFQLDLRARELRRNGIKVRVPDQSVQILAMLLACPGEVVTREDLRARLWPNGTIVEFEHSVNAAIKRLRQALEDPAATPKYVETVPRVGYRFIGSIEPGAAHDGVPIGECDAAGLELEDRTLSHYRILDKLGEGGMGVVHRAQDTRLNRTVAIKMLSEDFSSDPQARERFAREAHAIASLDHPNICRLYDIGRRNLTDFLVLEYLDGETLAHRLEKGPLPPEQVVGFGIQIASALAAAHRQNVIHRDLKPGNLMITKSGVKLLDFGLAKLRPAGGNVPEEPSAAATPLTGEGTILGTVQYMAPEQLEGKEADARTDIFALGAVIYEMATGRRAFEGASHASLVSAIMSADLQPVSATRPDLPPALDHVIRTCLAKDPDARWQTAHDVLVELRWISEAGDQQPGTQSPSSSQITRREAIAWACCGAASLTAATVGLWGVRRQAARMGTVHFQIVPPRSMRILINGECAGSHPVVSPDGQQIAWVAATGSEQALWVRALNSPDMFRIPNTENARMPFWSPNSGSLGFFANGRLKKVNIASGTVQDLCKVSIGFGGTWNRDGEIVFSSYRQPLYRISAAGGEAAPFIGFDKQAGETGQTQPSFLPDGRHVLYTSQQHGSKFVSLASPESSRTQNVIPGADLAMCVDPGYIVFHAGDSVLVQRFDTRKLRMIGEPRRIADRVNSFSASPGGVLAYHNNPSALVQFRWYSRDGKRLSEIGSPGEFKRFALSPDGKRLAVVRIAEPPLPATDIWLLDVANGVLSRLTSGGTDDPLWSSDGRRLFFTCVQNGRFCVVARDLATGHEQLLLTSEEGLFAKSRSNDGSFVVTVCGLGFGWLQVNGDHQHEIFLRTEFDKDGPSLSPDGQLLAWDSSESGRWEVYAASFPGMTQQIQVSNAGGSQPKWRGDGKELFYLALDGKLMAVDVSNSSRLSTSSPRPLFETAIRTSGLFDQYCPAADGQRFFLADPVDQTPDAITVVVNWTAGLTA